MSAASTMSLLKWFHSSSETPYLFSRASHMNPDARESVFVAIQYRRAEGRGGSAKDIRRESAIDGERSTVSDAERGGCRVEPCFLRGGSDRGRVRRAPSL